MMAMSVKPKGWWLLAAVSLAMQIAHADDVRLTNGDVISGEFVSLDDEQLVIDTPYAEELTIERRFVAGVETDTPVTVRFPNDAFVTGRLSTTDAGRMRIQAEEVGATGTFTLAEVERIYSGDPTAVDLTGSVSIGASRTSGNSDTGAYNLIAELRARTADNRYTLTAAFDRETEDDDRTRDEALGFLKYDHFLAQRWFLFNSATFQRDELADLNLRTALAAGAGYQFFETDDRLLYLEAGPSYVVEDFEDAEDTSFLAARYSLSFEQQLFDDLRLFHFQEGLFSVESFSDYIIRTRSGLRYTLTDGGLVASLQANVEYDNSPAPGNTTTDKEYLLLLGYLF